MSNPDPEPHVMTATTKVKNTEFRDFQWLIKDFDKFISSPSNQLSQEFGPIDIDKLGFRVFLNKHKVLDSRMTTFQLQIFDNTRGKKWRGFTAGVFKVQAKINRIERFNQSVMDFEELSTQLFHIDTMEIQKGCTLEIFMEYLQSRVETYPSVIKQIPRPDFSNLQIESIRNFKTDEYGPNYLWKFTNKFANLKIKAGNASSSAISTPLKPTTTSSPWETKLEKQYFTKSTDTKCDFISDNFIDFPNEDELESDSDGSIVIIDKNVDISLNKKESEIKKNVFRKKPFKNTVSKKSETSLTPYY